MLMTWTNLSNVSIRIMQSIKSRAPASIQPSHVEMMVWDVRYYDERRPTQHFNLQNHLAALELCKSYNDFKYSTKSFFSCSVKPSLLKLS